MAARHFLEEIGKPYSTSAIGNAKAWEVRRLRNDPTLPPLMYVVESEAGERFLLGRELSGRPKFNLIRYIAKTFIDLFFEKLKGKELSQYLILRDAYPLDLQYPIGSAPPYDRILLPTGFIRIEKALNPEGTGWEARGQDLIGEYRGSIWLIPAAAVASGTTVAHFLRNGFSHHLPSVVYLLTASGSLEGIQRVYQECQRRGVELVPVFSQCLFEVSKTGNLAGRPLSDLSVLNPGSIATREFFEKASRRYQGARMCSVGDIGESLEDPVRYTVHTLWEMQALGMDPKKEDWDKWTVDLRSEGLKKRVQEFDPAVFEYFKQLWD